jgi:hypothetical protein
MYEKGYHYYLYELVYEDERHEIIKSILNETPPVVVNEIMFRPTTGEPEWIELKKLRDVNPLAGLKFFSDSDSVHVPHFTSEYALLVARSTDASFMREHYDIPSDIPIFTGLGRLILAGRTLEIRDYDDNTYEIFDYSPNFSLVRGVSAERISPILPPEEQNWSPSLVISTPGKKNSVFLDVIPTTVSLEISNNPFSPTRNEQCLIKIAVPEQRVRATLIIYDIQGRERKKIADKLIIPGDFVFIWNGNDMNNRKVSPGAYPLYLNIETLNGKTIYQTKRVIYIGR